MFYNRAFWIKGNSVQLGSVVFKAILSIHGSNQNKILSPFPTLKAATLSRNIYPRAS